MYLLDLNYINNAEYIDPSGAVAKETLIGALVHESGHALGGYSDFPMGEHEITPDNFSNSPNLSFTKDIFDDLGISPRVTYAGYDTEGSILQLGRDYAQGHHIGQAIVGRGAQVDFDISGTGTNFDVLMVGGNQNNHFTGAEGNDLLYGEGGDDVLRGDGGDDHLYGGAGNDSLNGGSGDNELHGDSGDDTLSTSGDVTHMYGGSGGDRFEVGSNAIEVHVHSRRRKLGTDFILNVRGVGYRVRPGR